MTEKDKSPDVLDLKWKSFFSKHNAIVGVRIAFVIGLMMLVGYRLVHNPASSEIARANTSSPSPAATIKLLSSVTSGLNQNGAGGIPTTTSFLT